MSVRVQVVCVDLFRLMYECSISPRQKSCWSGYDVEAAMHEASFDVATSLFSPSSWISHASLKNSLKAAIHGSSYVLHFFAASCCVSEPYILLIPLPTRF